MNIPFNQPYSTGREIEYMTQSVLSGKLSGNQYFGRQVIDIIKKKYQDSSVFLTPSCTSALEMGVMLSGLGPGDEVIMPSFTFSSTANAVMVFGAKPVFCEVNPDTMNIDVSKIATLITPRTKMIIPIDYAGVPCELGEIMLIAEKFGLIVMLDAAQSYGAYVNGEPTGKIAHLTCFSFHETKNYSCGEGGALLVNVPDWSEKASYMQEKGTDRKRVMEGFQNKYSWIERGSSYLMSDVLAAMLLAQLECEEVIEQKRSLVTSAYNGLFEPFVQKGLIRTMRINSAQKINHHAYWIILDSNERKKLFINLLEDRGVPAYISYVPLHSSKMGMQLGYKASDLGLTEEYASKLVRLPLFADLSGVFLEYTVRNIREVLNDIYDINIVNG